jgi:hypothetical protein
MADTRQRPGERASDRLNNKRITYHNGRHLRAARSFWSFVNHNQARQLDWLKEIAQSYNRPVHGRTYADSLSGDRLALTAMHAAVSHRKSRDRSHIARGTS